jgi:hypothetical protein
LRRIVKRGEVMVPLERRTQAVDLTIIADMVFIITERLPSAKGH